MRYLAKKAHILPIIILLISCTYCIFELLQIPKLALTADEFVFARHIYDYTLSLPYRDFSPYKTVLGYYLLALPFYFNHDWLQPLFYIKAEIALINALAIIALYYFASLIYDKKIILLVILAVLANSSFLIYSVDLRVDMLTSWVCVFAGLAFLCEHKKLAGILLGMAFLISQKAIWYIAAINVAYCICWYAFPNTTFNKRSWYILNVAIILPIIFYIIIWSFFAGFSSVFDNLFYQAYIQAGISSYTSIYLTCWLAILSHGPILFSLWPCTLISISKSQTRNQAVIQRTLVICFASTALLQIIMYKQAFPYNMVFTVPAFFLLYCEFFSWLLSQDHVIARYKVPKQSPSSRAHEVGVGIATSPTAPRNDVVTIFLILFITLGILYPLYQSITNIKLLNNTYQKQMLTITANLIKKEGEYLSGVPFFYNKEQPIAGMRNLITPVVEYLYQPSTSLEKLFLPSLYLTPITQQQILTELEQKPIKVIINNYRIHILPSALQSYFQSHYAQYNGSVYLYAPEIRANQRHFKLKFSDKYRVVLDKTIPSSSFISIDGATIKPNQVIFLKKGMHDNNSNLRYRLKLLPNIMINNHPTSDTWQDMLRAIIA